jgi:hypothetical protein
MTRCPCCASEGLRIPGAQPGRVGLPALDGGSCHKRNPLSAKVECKDCGHVWYHEIERVDMTEGEAEDMCELAPAYQDYWS